MAPPGVGSEGAAMGPFTLGLLFESASVLDRFGAGVPALLLGGCPVPDMSIIITLPFQPSFGSLKERHEGKSEER